MANIRRERLLAWFNKAPCKGDRGKLIAASGLTKGRIAQLFDDEQPFGERAAAALATRLGLESDFFEHNRSMGGAGLSTAQGSGSLAPGATPPGAEGAAVAATASLTLGSPASSGSDSLALAIATIASQLRSSDAMARDAIAPFLANIAYAPNDVERITRVVKALIEAHREQEPPEAVAESSADIDSPKIGAARITSARQDARFEEFKNMFKEHRAADKAPTTIKRVVRKASGNAK